MIYFKESFMKWWVKGIIASVVWIGLCIGYAFLFFPAQTTPEQDAHLSELLGEVLGGGMVLVWVAIFLAWGPKKNDR
jgi:hypothetical protein